MIFPSSALRLLAAASVALATLSTPASASSACVFPTGINDDLNGIDYDTTYAGLLPVDRSIFISSIGTALNVRPGLADYETPVQVRATMASVAGVYGAAAAFEPKALEMFGRIDVSEQRRRCPPETTGPNGEYLTQELFERHRRVTLAYACVWSLSEFIPQIREALGGLGASWGLDVDKCRPLQSNDDPDCQDLSTPWGLAKSIVEENIDIFANDGWNADGSLSSTYNRVPFQDWRHDPYKPKTNPQDCPSGEGTCWQPLLEHDSLGFLYRQEHVASHIGQTARSIFLGDDDVCSRALPPPDYDYDVEAKLVLERTAALNDVSKAEVEFFDSKLTSLVPLQVQYYLRTGVVSDDFAFIQADAAVIAALYESVIVSWKEKVIHDRVRPTTYIREKFGKREVYSYLGPEIGEAGLLKAEEWQPYKRVMPHAEYPSGSSCLCLAFAELMADIAASGDDVTSILGGPLVLEVPAGSSQIEQDQPGQNLTLMYGSWSEAARTCSESRLNGGMHFSKAVPDGEDLCRGIGTTVAKYFKDLEQGAVPDFVADVKKEAKKEVRCNNGGGGNRRLRV